MKLYKLLDSQYSTLSAREKLLILIAALLVIFFSFDYFVTTKNIEKTNAEMENWQNKKILYNELNAQIDITTQRSKIAPEKYQGKLENLKKESVELDQSVKHIEHNMIALDDMNAAINQITSNLQNLSLLKFKYIDLMQTKQQDVAIFKHVFELEIVGEKKALGDFLGKMINFSHHFFIDTINFDSKKKSMTLTIYAISQNSAVLGFKAKDEK